MSDHVYRVVEVVGSSGDSIDGAIKNAVGRAQETVRNLEWFEVRSDKAFSRHVDGEPLASARSARFSVVRDVLKVLG